MKKAVGFCLIVCFFALMVSKVGAGLEEDAIAKIITDVSKAMTDFPKTRDIKSILRFYAKDYTEISNGEPQTLSEMERLLTDLEDQINLGKPVGISDRVSNIKAQVSGTIGWATFDEVVKIGAGGQVLEEEQSKCTGIFKKKGTEWLIQHEHCSTPLKEKANQLQEPTQ